ncbi:MAG: 50S ribosomal protein L9 [Patescibacteria group bacterium]
MKLLFLKDVKGTAKRGELKEVTEGYAMNFLLPKNLAVLATAENLAKSGKELDRKIKVKKTVVDQSRLLADRIRGRKIELKAKANPAGKLYAAINEAEVKQELARLGFNIKNAKVIFKEHIKEAGDYKAAVDFGGGIHSAITILVRV